MRRGGEAGCRARRSCGAGHLTGREIEVLLLVATGLCSGEIARRLRISPRTVDDHLSVMRQRAGAADRCELIARCYAAEILLPGWPPRWSGRRCLQIRQRPGYSWPGVQGTVFRTRSINDSAGAFTASDNPRVPRFPHSSGGIDQDHAAERPALETGQPPCGHPGVLIGYARVSASDQSLDRQITALSAAGCSRIFADTGPGKSAERPELLLLLDYARPGDAIVVASLDRLARSLQDLISLVVGLRQGGVGFKALDENLDTTTPGGRLIFDVFAALAGFLRELIVDGTREGLAAARARGHVGGRPTVMSADKVAAARALLPEESIASIARQIGVSRSTLYAHMGEVTAGTLNLPAGYFARDDKAAIPEPAPPRADRPPGTVGRCIR